MNERIKKLAEEAGSTHKQSLGVYQFYPYELEKFAELIVGECAEVSENYAGGSMPLSIALAIKEHFGVKE